MLKRIPVTRLLTCLMLVCASACVSPAHASSADIMIVQVQAGNVNAATQEFVALFNNSLVEVDVTGWCLSNKSAVSFVCFTPDAPNQRILLPANSFAIVASQPYAEYMEFSVFAQTYTPTHSTSGSIVGSSDTISLIDASGETIDVVQWATSLAGGSGLERHIEGYGPLIFTDTDSPADWSVQSMIFPYDNQTEVREVPIDSPPEAVDAIDPPVIIITELLPNAAGSDTGKEFIEVYNPNEFVVELEDYRLLVGPNFEKTLQFPAGVVLLPLEYKSFTNGQIDFSLLNTSSRVKVVFGDTALDETPAYVDPKDDMAWALIEGVWQYTNQPTPGAVNTASQEDPEEPEQETALKPCAPNQYRSPETNRCRLLATASDGTLKPCKDNQYRSEETNRCRNIDGSDDELAACKEGQVRNPETNRCRNVTQMSDADYGVLGTQTTAGNNWYIFAAVGGIILLAGAYAVWEWRQEIAKGLRRVAKFVRFKK